jgi:hypothetical protein
MSATAVESAGVITLTGAAGEEAIAQSEVTTAEEDTLVSFEFTVGSNAIKLRVGSTAGGQEIVSDTYFLPGYHVISFTPGVTTYYVQFILSGVGIATVSGFARIAAGALALDTPYSAADMAATRFDQSNNTMFFANGSYETQVLERRGQYSFSFRPFMQLDGPFAGLNLSSTTLTPDARTGRVTITASTALFTTMDAGGLLRLTHPGQFETADLAAVDSVTDAIRVTGVEGSRVFQVSITGTWSGTVVLERSIGNEYSYETYATYTGNTTANIDDDLDNQIIYYRLRCSAYTSGAATSSLTYAQGVTDGIARIVSVNADNEVTADVIQPFGKTIATSLWYFGAWSGRYGYPDAVTLFDGRLWFARGNEYFGSASDNFSSFDVGPLADQAINRTFTGRMSRARWMRGASALICGMAGFESQVGSNALDDVIIPENVRSKPVQARGSAASDPVVVGTGPVFISRSKERLYHLLTDGNAQVAMDLTRLNRDIAGSGGFKQIDFQVEPEPRIWAVREDGQVGVLVYDDLEQVMAWCRMVVDGYVESVCCLPGTPEDEVYFVVRRTIDGSTVRYIEKLAPQAWDTLQEANRLHCSLVYSGSSTSSLSGLDHLEAREDVYVWANGQQAGPFTVTSGAIADVGFEFTYAIAGLLYEGTYKSGRLNWGAAMGSAIATNKQIEKAGLILHQTAGGAVSWGGDLDDMETLPDREMESLTYDSAVQLFSEDREESVMGWTDRDSRLYIKMSTAGPATVLGIATTLKTNG